MPAITAPMDERSRLKALRSYHVLDTLPEQALDDLTTLTAMICEVPMAMISLVDEHRQWFKSRIGIEAAETPRGISFCTHALGQPDLLIVPDATQDARFAESPLVTCAPGVRFYAGAPLITPEGAAIGTLCVNDRVPRTLTPMQQEALRVLAGQVMTHLELRRYTRELVESEERLRVVTDNARVGLVIVNRERRYVYANDTYAEILGLPSSAITGQRVADVLAGIYEEQIRPRLDRAFTGERVAYELHKPSADGERHYAVRYEPTKADGEVKSTVVVITDITERRQAKEGLLEAVRFAQSTIDALSAHMCVLDENGTILATNEAWRRFAEANPPAAKRADTGDNYLLVCDSWVGAEAADAAAFAAGIHAVLHGERAEFTMEYACHSPSEQRWFVGRVTRFPGGGPVRVVVAHENITERKLAETVSLRLAAIVASSDDAIIGKDLNGVITSWNRGAEKIFGYTPGEMTGTSIMQLIPADRQYEEEQILGKIRHGESVEHFETLRLTKDGRMIHVSVTASPIRDAAGKILGASKVARDITARKHAEAALRESEELFSAAFRSSPAAIALNRRRDMMNIEVNDAFLHMHECTREDIVGHCFLDVCQLDAKTVESLRFRLSSGGSVLDEEIEARTRSGKVRHVNLSINLIHLRGEDCALSILIDITERKQAEQARRDTQARLNSALAAGSIGTWTWDIVSDRLTADEFTAGMFSIEPEAAAKGLPAGAYLQAVAEEDRPGVADGLARAIESCGHYDIEYRVRQKDGEIRWLQAKGRVDSDAAGKALNFHGAVMDITARKHAEETLRASEGRYRALFENAPDGIVIADPESTYLDANASICRMLGYAREELIGLSARDIVVSPEVRHIGPALKVLNDNADYHREWKFRRKDGSVFDAEVIATMMPDGNLLGMIRDITGRRRAEEQIAEQAAFLDKAQDAILVRDLEGGILFWNKGAERIYGWTREEVTGRNISGLLYADPKKFMEVNGLAISHGEWHGELQHLTRDEGEITVEARWTLIRDNEGRPKSVLAINTDITEKKNIEAQFMRAQRMESIGTLAGGIAHDLNNVLGPIMLSLELLKTKFPDPESTELLDMLSTSAQHGADMVRQVLSFARGVEGRRMEVQIKHLVGDIEKFANDTFLKNVQVRTIIPRDLWTVLGDPTQIHQVLLNLCVNARDAMPNGGMLTLSAENLTLDAHYAGMNLEARPGSYVLIQVEDSGTGIPSGVIEKIFEPFFTTKELGKGTGLGLSTSLAIVKSHGGFFQVYSEVGKGTKFRVYFPAQTEASAETAAEIAAELPRGNGELILVVDDESSVRQITQRTLQTFGYRVILASDGSEAVAVYARQGSEIAAVLTDMMMPVMDGPATIQVLRKLNPAVRIIAASGLSSSGHTAGLGVKHFLPKPYTAGTLLKALKQIMEEEP